MINSKTRLVSCIFLYIIFYFSKYLYCQTSSRQTPSLINTQAQALFNQQKCHQIEIKQIRRPLFQLFARKMSLPHSLLPSNSGTFSILPSSINIPQKPGSCIFFYVILFSKYLYAKNQQANSPLFIHKRKPDSRFYRSAKNNAITRKHILSFLFAATFLRSPSWYTASIPFQSFSPPKIEITVDAAAPGKIKL